MVTSEHCTSLMELLLMQVEFLIAELDGTGFYRDSVLVCVLVNLNFASC